MAISEFGTGGGSALRLGPEQNEFNNTDQATTEADRDSYFSANPGKLAVYDGNSALVIRLIYLDDNDVLVTRYQSRIAGAWTDVSNVVTGPPGEVASLAGVPVGEIPYKTVNGTFAGSNMRILEDGSILAPPGFSVESGSVTFGEALTLSEVSGFLGITNHLNDRMYTVLDFWTPSDAPSAVPSIFHLTEAEHEFVAQSIDTTNIPDNPLIFQYSVQNTARSSSLKFRTYTAMSNVRVKISLVSNGVALKYIPNRQAWEEEVGGMDWTLGDNLVPFGDTPLNLSAGTLLKFEIYANVVALKGNASGIPYFTATLQVGEFRDVIMDNVYTASDIKSKLESLSSPNKLSKTAIQDAVLSVNTQTGDVVIGKADVSLGNVDNTSDVNKPVSTAQATAISASMTAHNTAVDPHPQYTTLSEAVSAAPVQSVNTLQGDIVLTTANISESGNLYYSDSRVTNYLTSNGYTVKSGSSIGSGSAVYKQNNLGNLEFRSITSSGIAVVTQNANDINISVPANTITSVNGQTGVVNLTTTNISEGTNLYYTDARVGTYLTTNGYTVKSVNTSGVGASVYNANTAGAVTLRSIIGTGQITVTQNTNDITISTPLNVNGVYTPTITNISNIQAVTAFQCMYRRVGDQVSVNGRINIDPTTNGSATSIEMTLPVASNLTALGDLAGTSACPDTNQSGGIFANIATDRAVMTFQAGSNAARDHYFSYSYRVL